jgi:hypothetical protein
MSDPRTDLWNRLANSNPVQLMPLQSAAWLAGLEVGDVKWLLARGRFPRPLTLRGKNNRAIMVFHRGEIEDWIWRRLSERDAVLADEAPDVQSADSPSSPATGS